MNSVQMALATIANWLAWLPSLVVAILIVVVALGIANLLHKYVRRLLRATLAPRYPYALSVITQMRGATRLAVFILAMVIAVPVVPFDPDTSHWLARLLLILVVVLIGWAARPPLIPPAKADCRPNRMLHLATYSGYGAQEFSSAMLRRAFLGNCAEAE
jgi:hypothetical protein